MTIHEHPEHDFDPDEQAAWEEFQRSLDALHYPGARPPTILPTTPALGGIVDWALLLNGDHATQDWLVEPFLARGRAHALYAPAKAGKSLLALEVAAAMASGRACLHQPAGPPRPVVYVDLEMTEDDLRERVEDLEYAADELALLRYFLLPPIAPLDTAAGGGAVLAEACRAPCDLVVVDTVSRAISGAENDADTIIALARHTFTPLKRQGIASLRCDHSGKDIGRGQRGTSAKNDDVDIVWQLTVGDADTLTLRATHRRLSWVPEKVDLTRVADPLRHLTGAAVWPAGTLEAARKLDDAEASLDVTVRAARVLIGGKTTIVAAAVKYRRTMGNEPGKQETALMGKQSKGTSERDAPDLGETARETLGNTLSGKGETFASLKDATFPSLELEEF